MKIRQMDVTPAKARKWLEDSEGFPGRRISRQRVLLYAEDMREGRWRETPVPIQVTKDGVVIDGRHRLSALVEADVTLPFVVDTDADAESFPIIDSGKGRTGADMLNIAGFTSAGMLHSAIRLYMHLLAYDEGEAWNSARKAQYSRSELLEIANSDVGHIIRVNMYPADKIARGIRRFGVRTPVAVALTRMELANAPLDLHTEFTERLADGANLGHGSPILVLRRFLLSDSGGYQLAMPHMRGFVATGGIIKAYNAWISGETISQLRMRENEAFPVVKVAG